jgi:hypothetical protein
MLYSGVIVQTVGVSLIPCNQSSIVNLSIDFTVISIVPIKLTLITFRENDGRKGKEQETKKADHHGKPKAKKVSFASASPSTPALDTSNTRSLSEPGSG